jgi:hypothetical protein
MVEDQVPDRVPRFHGHGSYQPEHHMGSPREMPALPGRTDKVRQEPSVEVGEKTMKYQIEKLSQGRINLYDPLKSIHPAVRVRVEIGDKMYSSGIQPTEKEAIDELIRRIREIFLSAVWKQEKGIDYVEVPDPLKTDQVPLPPPTDTELEILGRIIKRLIEPSMNGRQYVWVGSTVEDNEYCIAFKKDRLNLEEIPLFVKVKLP